MDGGSVIRTPDQRVRVFVSSTLSELAEERATVRQAIERLHLTPVMFELGARPHPPRDLYRAYLRQSEVFVGIYGERYGWVAPGESVSGLEDEYTLSEGMPRLLYVKAPAEHREPLLEDLLRRIEGDDTASYTPFGSPEELARLVSGDLALLLSERFISSPVRGAEGPSSASLRPNHNLPVQLSSFVGREAELADVKQAIARSRLVTLTGVGGSGKSRLALQTATELVDEFADGAWLVDLASVTEPARVPTAVASALTITEDPQHPLAETLVGHLRSKHLLLLVDNCEHVLAACADLTATLLSAAPDVVVLATSREGLALPGEVIIPVPSLAVPPDSSDVDVRVPAVRLFAERATAVRPDFEVTPANAPAVVEIVRRLDGIPLAIELAAARVKVLSPEQIATRLSDRFRLLSGGARTALPHQQTLRAAMDWSYDLLEAGEQRLLRCLSVFAGSWTIDAAESVAGESGPPSGDVLDLLGRLVDKSLVVVVHQPGENRYRLLETVRQYGRGRSEEAGEADANAMAHRDWCASVVEASARHLRGGQEQTRWLEFLEWQHDDLHAALEWSWGRLDATASLGIAVGSSWFWYLHGHWDEGRRSLERSLSLVGTDPALRARGSAWAAVFAWRRGDSALARRYAEASLAELAGTGDEAEGLSLLALALVAISEFDYPGSEEAAHRALQVFRAQDHMWGVTTSLLVLARIASNRRSGRLDDLLRESAALVASGGDMWGRAHVLTLQGYEAFRSLDLDLAADLHTTARTLAAELGDRAVQAENLLALGHIHLLRGQEDAAGQVLGQARALVERLRDPHDLGHVDQGFALLAVSRGDTVDGQALLDDVAGRFVALDKAPMGSAYALGMADVYRRAGRRALAAALLRHALTLLDETSSPEQYAQARRDLANLESSPVDEATPQP